MNSPQIHALDDLDVPARELRAMAEIADYAEFILEGELELIAAAPAVLSRQVAGLISERLKTPARLDVASYRLTDESVPDGGSSYVAGGGSKHPGSHVALLNLNGGARSGPYKGPKLAIWRHKASGMTAGPAASDGDRVTMAAWDMAGAVDLIPERVVLVPADCFVSLWPMRPEGFNVTGGRLIWSSYLTLTQ